MYGWIWRRLPGPTVVRLALAVLLVGTVVALLFLVVFPAVAGLLPANDVTVGAEAPGRA